MRKHYTVQLVGEQYYQPAAYLCRIGDTIDICIEQGNPVDPLAIVARRRGGNETIGYIAIDSFVRGVLHDDGHGLAAAVASLRRGERGFREISLLVSIVDEPASTVAYRADEASDYQQPSLLAGDAPPSRQNGGFNSAPWIIGALIIIAFLLGRCSA